MQTDSISAVQERYKAEAMVSAPARLIIAIASGLLCLVLARFGIVVIIGETRIDVPWAVVFPMIVAMAYGPRYGIIAGIAGGATYPFALWPDNGWANVLTAVIGSSLFAGLGTLRPLKFKEDSISSLKRLVIIMAVFITGMTVIFMLFFNKMLSFNPPFWEKYTINNLSQSLILSFAIKDSINFAFIAFAAEVLLSIPALRRFYGLPVYSNMRLNTRIVLWSLIVATLTWTCFIGLEFALIDSRGANDSSYSKMALFLFIWGGFIVARVLINHFNRRLDDEEKMLGQNKKLIALNEELENAKARAEESDRLKSAFLANLSHEIRTPMNAIVGFSDLLMVGDHSNLEMERYINTIQSSSRQLLMIINDVLEISRIETGQLRTEKNSVDIGQMMNDLFEQTRVSVTGEKGIDLLLDLPPSSHGLKIVTDEVKLRQVISNLMINAVKFTDSGYIKLGVSYPDKQHIRFSVEDTGIGIEKKYHDSIFERFNQVDQDLDRNRSGSGLGLAISKGYIEHIGGTISLESERGKGSVFAVTLPLIVPEQDKKEALPEVNGTDNKRQVSNGIILIAEDDDTNYLYFSTIFSKTGFRITRARNGIEAVEACSANNDISLVLMDIKMPLMDGYEATRKIKEINPALPVIAQTAHALSEDELKIGKEGFDGYITKPMLKKDLLNLIESFHKR